jgi:ketosteroid isomerase-like protein
MLMRRIAARLLLLAAATLVAAAAAAADDFQDARELYRRGDRSAALETLERHLGKQPRDARARFLKGVILSEQNRRPDAIEVFTALTQDFPELPEPYNNLAVLYAAQGNYQRAREALEMAIRTHPSYATAHENLGDIYAAMARQAYDKALELDKGNDSARTKLQLIRELLPARSGEPQADAPPAAAPAGAAPAASEDSRQAPQPAQADDTASLTTSEVDGAVAPGADPAAAAATPPAPPSGTSPAPARNEDRTQAVLQMVEDWARAWSRGDADAYLSFYAPDFRTPQKEPRAQWIATRRDRLAKAKDVSVKVMAPKVRFADADRATVTFRQDYSSDTFKGSGQKTLQLVRQGQRWLIQQETITRL